MGSITHVELQIDLSKHLLPSRLASPPDPVATARGSDTNEKAREISLAGFSLK